MQPRLLIGDYLLVAKWPYGYSRYALPYDLVPFKGRLFGRTPARGDVVVFDAPAEPGKDWIKRVIGLPGDHVQVVHGVVQLNGKAVPRTRIGDLVIPVAPNMIAAGGGGTCALALLHARIRAEIARGRTRLPLSALSRDAAQWQKLRRARSLRQRNRQYAGLCGARRACLRHGRQSRPQPGQPLRRREWRRGHAADGPSGRGGPWSPSSPPTARARWSSPGPGWAPRAPTGSARAFERVAALRLARPADRARRRRIWRSTSRR